MKINELPRIEYLNECFEYQADTGRLIWKRRPRAHFSTNSAFCRFDKYYPGTEAGSVKNPSKNKLYLEVKINNRLFKVHRIIAAMTGMNCQKTIDHINGDGLDNRLENLREASPSDNNKNRRIGVNNKTGLFGVFKTNSGKWNVIIGINYKQISLGCHADFFEACCARKSAEARLGFHENHGNPTGWA